MKRAKCVWTLVAMSLFIAGWGIGCSLGPLAGVGTTNGCSISALGSNIEGSAPPFSFVLLYDVNYIPFVDSGSGIITASDERGCFQIKALARGAMNAVIMDKSGQNAALFDSLVVGSDATRDTARFSFLFGTGAITGVVVCDSQPKGTILVYCTGTDFCDILRASGAFTIPSVPQGTYKIQAVLLGVDSTVTQPIILVRSNPDVITVLKGATSNCDTLTIR